MILFTISEESSLTISFLSLTIVITVSGVDSITSIKSEFKKYSEPFSLVTFITLPLSDYVAIFTELFLRESFFSHILPKFP